MIATGAANVAEALEALRAIECEESLMEFVREFWEVVEPGRSFTEGRVLEEMVEHLQGVTLWMETDGEEGIRNLLTNVPPGCMKSLLTDVFWPAWEWGPRHMPHLRYVCSSYSEDLTLRDNLRFAAIIKSEKYQRWWGDRVQVTKDTESKIANTAMGWKIATSVGGLGTGERGDRFIVDDPHNVKDGESEAKRTTTLIWWREVVPTRLNDADLSSIVVIMQRVHEEDVSGDIIERKLPFVLLRLPMEYDPEFPYCTTPMGGEWRETKGELLWPERFGAKAVAELKHTMGRYATASQLQQTPSPRGGGIILDTDWQLWDGEYAQRIGIYDPKVDEKLPWPEMQFVVASLDTAFGVKQENDFNALTILGVWRDENDLPKIMLMDAWKKRLTLHGTMPPPPPRYENEGEHAFQQRYLRMYRKQWGLVEHVVYSCRRLKVDRLLIEDSAKGKDVSEELVRLFSGEKWTNELVAAVLDKVARLYSVQHLFSQGLIFAPDMDWAEGLIRNTSNFPKVTHDDDVDSLSQGLRWLRDSGWALRRDERDRDLERAATLESTRPLPPLYDV